MLMSDSGRQMGKRAATILRQADARFLTNLAGEGR
jgi:hypothetical protein